MTPEENVARAVIATHSTSSEIVGTFPRKVDGDTVHDKERDAILDVETVTPICINGWNETASCRAGLVPGQTSHSP
jgi:hypothetical protein